MAAASPGVGSDFRELAAYRLAAALADEVHATVRAWPSFDRWTLGQQLVRAADSVGANIAEAMGRWHLADRRKFLLTARGSLQETEHWLLRAEARGLVEAGTAERVAEPLRALNGLTRRPNP